MPQQDRTTETFDADLMTMKELAAWLRRSEQMLRKDIAEGRVPSATLSAGDRHHLWSKQAVTEFLVQRASNQSAAPQD